VTSETAVRDARRLDPEDEARANFYALLARLYASAPDAALLHAIAVAPPLAPVDGPENEAGLAARWDALRAASADADPAAVAEEFQALFIGVGKSEVSLYASHYLRPQSGRPLADFRAALAEQGLARQPDASEFEDHLSVVLETMRMLAAGCADRPPATIAEQRAFCETYLLSWVFGCCTAITQCAIANYYVEVAQFTRSFLALERDSFAIE
jgi:TorA maturation chaperone TorD